MPGSSRRPGGRRNISTSDPLANWGRRVSNLVDTTTVLERCGSVCSIIVSFLWTHWCGSHHTGVLIASPVLWLPTLCKLIAEKVSAIYNAAMQARTQSFWVCMNIKSKITYCWHGWLMLGTCSGGSRPHSMQLQALQDTDAYCGCYAWSHRHHRHGYICGSRCCLHHQ